METQQPLYISISHRGEHTNEAITFITEVYKKVFSADPPPPELLFVATRNEKVVGTLGIDYCDKKDGLLPLERIYTFNRSKTPLPMASDKIVQLGRWISREANVTKPLAYIAMQYLLAHQKTHGLFEQKGKAVQASKRTGTTLHPIENTTLNVDRVGDSVKEYYTSKPEPRLFMIDLKQSLDSMRRVAERSIKAGNVVVYSLA